MSYNTPNLPMAFQVSSNVNGLTTGATLIGITDSILTFVPQTMVIQCTAASGLVSLSTISIGTNSTAYNNIMSGTLITGLTGANQMKNFPLTGLMPIIAPGTSIFVNVTGIAVASAFAFNVIVLGFYM